MKLISFYIVLVLGSVSLYGCGSSQKVEKSPIATYVMPCSELVSGDGALRAWSSGKSDSEMAARKKAQLAASAELAAMLEKVVNATVEEYSVGLSENDRGAAKSFLSEKTKIVVNQTLKGAAIVCDRWNKDESTGQYTNYMVMELRGEEYLKALYKELDKNSSMSVDRKLLDKMFLEQINKNAQ